MPMPTDVPIIDLMLALPILDPDKTYANLRAAARDKESREGFRFPAQYMFRGVPHDWGKGRDPVEVTLEEMDKWKLERAMIGVHGEDTRRAVREHPNLSSSISIRATRGRCAVGRVTLECRGSKTGFFRSCLRKARRSALTARGDVSLRLPT